MDLRPSDLDPYPRLGRDLAAAELWDQSLARSHQRRRLERVSRSHRQRRKGTSLAVGAAMLAAPVVPAFAGSRGASPRGGPRLDTSSVGAATGGRTQLLRFGDVGPAVAAIQAQVGVATDGIFGPITRGAVERFQRAHGLATSGVVDARTWAALFHARVLFYDDSGSSARPASAERAAVRLVVDRRRDDDGGRDGGQRRSPAPSTSAPAPAPSGSVPSSSPGAARAARRPRADRLRRRAGARTAGSSRRSRARR